MPDDVINCSGCGMPIPPQEFEEGGRARVVGAQRFCPLCAETAVRSVLDPEEVERENLPRLRLPRYEGEADSIGVERRVERQRQVADEARWKEELRQRAGSRRTPGGGRAGGRGRGHGRGQ